MVVLEKTLESPLDCNKKQPVNPKGNRFWIFIGRTDAEAETPILWTPDVKNWLLGTKVITNLDSFLKSRDITLPTKVLVKAMAFPIVMYTCESWTIKKADAEELMLLNCGVEEDSWESLGLQGDRTSPSWRKSVLNIHWKDWCWS